MLNAGLVIALSRTRKKILKKKTFNRDFIPLLVSQTLYPRVYLSVLSIAT